MRKDRAFVEVRANGLVWWQTPQEAISLPLAARLVGVWQL
jgi:hypothetical protein